MRPLTVLFSMLLMAAASQPAASLANRAEISARSREAAAYARRQYSEATVETLRELVAFRTVHQEGVANAEQPPFLALKGYLRRKAEELGLDFDDRGAVLLIGLGSGPARLGIVTHGDVQPADPNLWAGDPFRLDDSREPGKLVGRGAEDDKGPLATALYALKTLRDLEIPLQGRIELIVALTEESDWEPFQEFLKGYDPPELNVALDANYPVVIAEKGWGEIHLTLPPFEAATAPGRPYLLSLTGGSFLSQVPEQAAAVIADPGAELEATLRAAAGEDPDLSYTFQRDGGRLRLKARGLAAHSMNPWDGRNAITHLALLLDHISWPDSQAARMVRLIVDLVGGGDYGERFGELAYSHPFMGRLTLTLATLGYDDGALHADLSLRRPVGRTSAQVEATIREAVAAWKRRTGIRDLTLQTTITDPYYQPDAPQVPVLLEIFRHYTGIADAQPISIGGGTNVRLLPHGVSFGPSMPGAVYTGHTEHEFITRDQLLLNLEMYTALLVELAGR